MEITMEVVIALGFTYLVLVFLILFLIFSAYRDRKQAALIQLDLIHRILATDLEDLARNKAALESTPRDHLKSMRLENDLAMEAAKIEEARRNREGIPV